MQLDTSLGGGGQWVCRAAVPQLHLKLSQSFAHARSSIAAITVKVNMCVKTNNFDGVCFHYFQWGIMGRFIAAKSNKEVDPSL
jgi:uncharacterized membrane protein